MKKVILACIILTICVVVFAQSNQRDVFLDYYKEPCFENFIKAFSYYSILADKDSIPDRAILNLMNIHKMETDRHLDYLLSRVDSLRVGIKFQLANLLLSYGEISKAIEIYDTVNIAAPDWSRPWRKKAEAFYKSKEYTKAEVALKKSFEGRNQSLEAYALLAEVYLAQKKYKLALESIDIAFEMQTEYPDHLGDLYTTETLNLIREKIYKLNKIILPK
ncbi:MAG: hypothetical protein FWG20_04270 [Candidatus Cloacimonetes bacterium]|nr:hypothetical protein [Candidatus Cloacimonadota bacterium]